LELTLINARFVVADILKITKIADTLARLKDMINILDIGILFMFCLRAIELPG